MVRVLVILDGATDAPRPPEILDDSTVIVAGGPLPHVSWCESGAA